MQKPSFTIRVYGIWINENEQILLTDERMGEHQFTKFPGGGLEFGEGTLECLQREWREELQVEIDILEHLYTTDFFQSSAFHQHTQILSIYYKVKPKSMPPVVFETQKNAFTMQGKEEVLFRWENVRDFQIESVTLPIDKVVAGLISKGLAY